MATNVPGPNPPPYGGGPGGGGVGAGGVLRVLGVGALIAIAIALFLLSNNVSTANCINKAQAQFPTVPVSAFVTANKRDTGPLKVSFSDQRQAAVKQC